MSKSIFDLVNDLTHNKIKWAHQTDEDKKSFNIFMTNRLLSMNIDYIQLVSDISQYDISKEQYYEIFYELLPKRKTYSKYIKGKNDEKKFNELIDFLSEQIQISKREASEYVDILISQLDGTSTVKNYLKLFGQYGERIQKISNI